MAKNMKLIEFFFPQNVKCLFCKTEDGGYGICDKCLSNLPFISGKACSKCGAPINTGNVCFECKHTIHYFDKSFSIFNYENEIKQTIISFKQARKKYIAKPLSHIIADYFDKLEIPFDTIIPMPIHPNRLKTRGFNQSELLLDVINSRYGRVYNNVLVRVKDTTHQTGLSQANRQKNLEHAFKVVDKQKVRNKIVLIFDDIYTTGATLDECAKTLKKAGAVKVYGLTLAHSVFNKSKVVESNAMAFDIKNLYV